MEPNVDRGMWSVVALLAAIVIGGVVLLAFPRISGKITNSMDETVNKAFEGETPSWVAGDDSGVEDNDTGEVQPPLEEDNDSNQSEDGKDSFKGNFKIHLSESNGKIVYSVNGFPTSGSGKVTFPYKMKVDLGKFGIVQNGTGGNNDYVQANRTLYQKLSQEKGVIEVFYYDATITNIESSSYDTIGFELSNEFTQGPNIRRFLSNANDNHIGESYKNKYDISEIEIKLIAADGKNKFRVDYDRLSGLTDLLISVKDKSSLTLKFVGVGDGVELENRQTFADFLKANPNVTVKYDNVTLSGF